MTTPELTTALAGVCGYHEGDDCQICAEVLQHRRGKGWTDAEILADIELYRTDFGAWCARVRERSAARSVVAGADHRGQGTIPPEAWDHTHPDHDWWVDGSGQCFDEACPRHPAHHHGQGDGREAL